MGKVGKALVALLCVCTASATAAAATKVTPGPGAAAGATTVPPPPGAGPTAPAEPPLAFWSVRALGVADAEAREIEAALEAAAQRIAIVARLVVLGREDVSRRLAAPAAAALAACDGNPDCVGEIAAFCGARAAIGGQVGGLGGTYSVNLALVAPGGKVLRRSDAVLERGAALALGAEEVVARLIAPDLSRGFLELEIDVGDAKIYVDGAEAGTSPLPGPLSVGVGKHAVRITHPSYRDFLQFVEVPYRAVVPLDVKLSAFPVLEGELTGRSGGPGVDPGPKRYAKLPWWRSVWAIGGVGVVLLAATATITYFIALPDYDFTIRVRTP